MTKKTKSGRRPLPPGEAKKNISVYVRTDHYDRLARQAYDERTTISAVVRSALDAFYHCNQTPQETDERGEHEKCLID